ncbi:MAG: hypothetical protein JXA69_14030, partial [Phycisphaerae bacterium]|nr:hypothetical protein [Phycisphaerae bacterium]
LLDTQPMADEVAVRIFPLKNADAENMAEVLKSLFDQGKSLADVPGKGIKGAIPEGVAGDAMAYNVSIATDPRTNTLIVAGQLEQIAFAQKVVDEMDIEGIGVKFPVQVLKLEHADPDRLADMITKLNQQRIDALKNRGVKSTEMERIFVIADPRTESLIISAKDENVKEVRELLQRLDAAPADFLGDIHIITLQNLTATDLGPKIEQLWERRMNLKSKRGETYDEMPVLIADTRSNAIIVASSKEDFLAIEALIKKLEQQPLAPTAQIRVHVLEHNEAGKVGPQLETLFEERAKMRLTKGQEEQPSDRITIVTDAATNTLLIASSQELYDEMVQLLSQLDVPLDVRGVLRLFTLQHADATRAAKMIEDLFTKGIQRSSGAPGSAIQESQRKVSIVTDTRSNTLIVSATQENFQIVESLLKQIDSEEAPSFTPDTRIFQVSYADAVKVADMMEKLFDGIKQGLPQPDRDELNMTFIPDERSNVVIVTGSRYGMRRAEELFEKIDREPGQPSGEIEVYHLQYSSSAKLAEMLTDLFEQRQKGITGNRTPLHILPDTGSNSLVVTGSRDDHVMVKHMLGLLDKASSLSQQMEIFPLQKAKAEDLVNTLTDLLEKQTGSQTETGFNIAAEPRTNSLVAFAGPDVMTNIRAIVERLDTAKPVKELGMRVIRLKQAKAEELAERLDDFLQKANEDNKEIAQIIKFRNKDLEQKLVHEDITIVPDARTNSLMVLAPYDSIEMLEILVEMLDEIKPITAEIQMFWLQNADAEETKDLLEELFMVGEGAQRGDEEQARQLTFAGEGLAAAGVTTGTVELAFSVDKRTNMLIAAGSAEYLEIVENIVYKLDDLDVQNRKQRIIKLNNGEAENIAQTMEAYFSAEEQAVETTDAEESLLRKLERQVTIEADEDSNSLLLSYNPRMEAKVIEMVNKLDQAPPQVMIQVLLAEVTLTDTVEMGMEFALQDLLFTEHAVTGPNDTIQGNNFDFVGGTDVGAIGSGSLGGFSFTITGEDFNFLLRALQTEGRLEVLSRPSIMVADNQEANITVGENVPVVERVSVTSGGVVVPQVNYRDVGILLDVEPHINADGYVNMHIMPEISSIGTSSVNVGSGVNLPIFNMRSADTWVTVRDGQTIVIGGLITTTEQEGENKVPVIGDIPWLGPLFRANRTETRKTELLIVLTPKVIRSEEEAHAISVQTRDETGFLDRIRTNPLMEKLQVKPADDQLGPTGNEPGGSLTPAAETEPKATEYGPVLDAFGPEAHILRSDATIRVAEGTKD